MHQDKFRIYLGDLNIKERPPSKYSYRRGIGKETWITSNGKDLEKFDTFDEMDKRLKELRRNE